MSGEVKKVNGAGGVSEPWSLDAWNQHSIQTIRLTDKLSVKVRTYDVLSAISADKNNPLLAIISRAANGGVSQQEASTDIFKDSDGVANLSETLNTIMTEVIVHPPLKEQGHKDGISVNQLTLNMKMTIFMQLVGGEQPYSGAEAFPTVQGSSVVAGPEQ